jgi:hypothetical protein
MSRPHTVKCRDRWNEFIIINCFLSITSMNLDHYHIAIILLGIHKLIQKSILYTKADEPPNNRTPNNW